MSKIKTVATKSVANTNVAVSCKPHQSTTVIEGTPIKVTVHIPDTVYRKQEKINSIYEILKPDVMKPSKSTTVENIKKVV